MGQDHRDVVTTAQGSQVRMILRFEHDLGDGHCLARLVLREPPLPPVAVFTSIRSNPRTRGIGTNLGRLADALVAAVGDTLPVEWDRVVWIAHHGEFSDWHIDGAPETFTIAGLAHFNDHFHDEIDTHRRLRRREFEEEFGDLGLEPVPDAVRALGWEF
ncbi:hypothetical protein FHS29_002579 [Saccharothrix tamanrassetensis]|uniref:Uncharacterized protein n=1 Tax=Saccharothrix tamanrassetensis TaxID=1051531 RepID=A0A841CIH3_9PSEU|nr:hypothetical protein [Saccharothrix tamanrassetensis]MBB5955998.1 hypothetical protein [Saccharothrix tamanrassetensis]